MSEARERRRRLIRELVAERALSSQGELQRALADRGVEAAQATLSRDLDELGIGKARGVDGGLAYALPEPGGLAQRLRLLAVRVDASGNLAVVRTAPGAAAAVASAIDEAGLPGVIGTVQGDDTLLVVADRADGGPQLARLLEGLRTGAAADEDTDERGPTDGRHSEKEQR